MARCPRACDHRRVSTGQVPWIVSVDDHVIEPPHVWQRWLPARLRDDGPRVVRDSYTVEWVNGNQVFRKGGTAPRPTGGCTRTSPGAIRCSTRRRATTSRIGG